MALAEKKLSRRDLLQSGALLGFGAAAASVMPSGAAEAASRPFPTTTYDRAKLAESLDNSAGYKDLMRDILNYTEGGGMIVLNFKTHDCSGCNVQTHVLEGALSDAQSILKAKVSMIDIVAYDEQGAVYTNISGHLYREATKQQNLNLPYGKIWRNGEFTGKHFSITRGNDIEKNKETIVRAIADEAQKTVASLPAGTNVAK